MATTQTAIQSPKFREAKHIHFTGIKGVGMAALALCAQDQGIPVSGSDVEQNFVTADILTQRNLSNITPFAPKSIPQETDLVIYSGANQGTNNPEVVEAQKRGIRIASQAEAVGEIMSERQGISVCGVGGKTSTSAMLANVFEYAGKNPSFLIGVGKVLNLQVPGRLGDGPIFIAEADEYAVAPGINNTPRFMYQDPQTIVCTNIAHDHPDIYPSINETKTAFSNFFNKLPENGLLVAHGDSAVLREIEVKARTIYFGQTPKNDWWVKESFIGQGKQLVKFASHKEEFNLTLSVPGLFNAKNALSAYIVAREYGISHEASIEGLQLFRGSKRRFEKVGEKDEMVFYDDYAHHPSEILATLKAAREWLPLNRLIAVFQPHTYSRTKVLLDQFSKSFTHADKVIITDIYGAREAPDPTISGYKLAEAIRLHTDDVEYVPREELVAHLKKNIKPFDAVFTMGAGDIYKIHEELLA